MQTVQVRVGNDRLHPARWADFVTALRKLIETAARIRFWVVAPTAQHVHCIAEFRPRELRPFQRRLAELLERYTPDSAALPAAEGPAG